METQYEDVLNALVRHAQIIEEMGEERFYPQPVDVQAVLLERISHNPGYVCELYTHDEYNAFGVLNDYFHTLNDPCVLGALRYFAHQSTSYLRMVYTDWCAWNRKFFKDYPVIQRLEDYQYTAMLRAERYPI